MSRLRNGCLISATMLLTAASGVAQPASGQAPAFLSKRAPLQIRPTLPLPQLVERLGAADLSVREDASLRLAQDASVTFEALQGVMRDPAIRPEQRLRLTKAAWERFETSPRAALGISFQNSFMGGSESGAVIAGTFPGFDSNRVLKPGDTIYSMDELRIRSMDDGKRVIQSCEPGDRVTLRIFRGGQPIIVRVTLGSLLDLQSRSINQGGARNDESMVLRDAFRLRLNRRVEGLAATIPAALDLLRFWDNSPAVTDERVRAMVSEKASQKRGADGQEIVPEAPTLISAGGRQSMVGEGQFDFFVANPGARNAKISDLARQLVQLQNFLVAEDARLDDPNIAPDRKAAAESRRGDIIQRMGKLKIQLQSMQVGGLQRP